MYRRLNVKYVLFNVMLIFLAAAISCGLLHAVGSLRRSAPRWSTLPTIPIVPDRDPEVFHMPCGGVAGVLRGTIADDSELELVSEDVAFKTYGWAMHEVSAMVILDYFTWEDFLYLTAVGHEEFTTFEGAYAVMCCVRNRLEQNSNYSSIKDVVTASGQFEGFHDPYTDQQKYEKYCTQNVIDAAVAILLGGESTIGDSYYFYGKVSGYDMWADAGIDNFYNVGGNVFFNKGTGGAMVHNMSSNRTSADILIYNSKSGEWLYPSGTSYSR